MIGEDLLQNIRVTKTEWKHMLKVGLERKLKMEMARVTGNMSKPRHVKKTGHTESAYVRSCSMKELTELLKLKLKMTSLKCN